MDVVAEKVQKIISIKWQEFDNATEFSKALTILRSLNTSLESVKRVLQNLSRTTGKSPNNHKEFGQYFKKGATEIARKSQEISHITKIAEFLSARCLSSFRENVTSLRTNIKISLVSTLLGYQYMSLSCEKVTHMRILDLLFDELVQKCLKPPDETLFPFSTIEEKLMGVIKHWKACRSLALSEYKSVKSNSSKLFSNFFRGITKYIDLWEDLIEISRFKNEIIRLEEALKYSLKNSDAWKPTIDYIVALTEPFYSYNSVLAKENFSENWHHVEIYKKEIPNVEQKVINLLKASFYDSIGVKEGCMILESFHNLARGSIIEELYKYKAKMLIGSLKKNIDKHKNKMETFYGYNKRLYASDNLNIVLNFYFSNRIRCLTDMLNFSTVFVNDPSKTGEIREYELIYKDKIESLYSVNIAIAEYKNINDSRKIFSASLLKRNRNNEMYLDVNVKHDLLEHCLYNVILFTSKEKINATKDITYHKQHSFLESYRRTRQVVNEYNYILSALSLQEFCLFQDKMKNLKKMIMEGMYKMQWQDLKGFKTWDSGSRRLISTVMEDIIAYKENNSQMYDILKSLSVPISSFKLYKFVTRDAKTFLMKINTQLNAFAKQTQKKCVNLIKKMETLETLQLISEEDTNGFKDKFEDRIISLLCRSYYLSIVRTIENLLMLFEKDPSIPFIKLNVNLQNFMDEENYVHYAMIQFLENSKEIMYSEIDRWKQKVTHTMESVFKKDIMIIENIFRERMKCVEVDIHKYFRSYEVFHDMSKLDPSIVLKKYAENNGNFDLMENDLKNIQSSISKCQNFFGKTKVHFYALDNKKILKSIYSVLKNWNSAFLDRIRDHFRWLVMSLENRDNKSNLVGEAERVAITLKKNSAHETEMIERFEKIKEYISQKSSKFTSRSDDEDETSSSSMSQEVTPMDPPNLNLLSELIEKFHNSGPNSISWRVEDALKEIQLYENELQKIREGTEGLVDFESILNKKRFVWKTVEEWKIFFNSVNNIQEYSNLSVTKIKGYIFKIFKKTQRAIAFEVVDNTSSLTNEIVQFSRAISVLEIIDKPFFKEQHFVNVRSLLHVDENLSPLNEDKISIQHLMSKVNENVVVEMQTAMKHQEFISELTKECNSRFKSLMINVVKHPCGIYLIENVTTMENTLLKVIQKIEIIDEGLLSMIQTVINPLKCKVKEGQTLLGQISTFQRNLVAISKLYLGYAIKLQLGKSLIKVNKIKKFWKFILANYLTKSYFVHMDIDSKLICILEKLSEKLNKQMEFSSGFISTRKIYFPRLFYKSHSGDPFDFEKDISSVIPFVKEALILKNKFVGCINSTGTKSHFLEPISASQPVEIIFRQIHYAVSANLKKEVSDIIKNFSLKTWLRVIANNSSQVVHIARMALFSKDLQRLMNMKQINKKSFSNIVNQHERLWKYLLGTLTGANTLSEKQFINIMAALNVELVIRHKISKLLEVHLQYEKDVHFLMYNQIKWHLTSLKKPGVAEEQMILVAWHDMTLKYSYEPMEVCTRLRILHSNLEKNTIELLNCFMSSKYLVIKGMCKTGKTFLIQHFAYVIGRYAKFHFLNLPSQFQFKYFDKNLDILAFQIPDIESLFECNRILFDTRLQRENFDSVTINMTPYFPTLIPRVFVITRQMNYNQQSPKILRIFNIYRPNLEEIVTYILNLYHHHSKVEFDVEQLCVLISFEKFFNHKKLNIQTVKLLLNNLLNKAYIRDDGSHFPRKILRYYELAVFNSKKSSDINDSIAKFCSVKSDIHLGKPLFNLLHNLHDMYELHDVMIFAGPHLTYKSTAIDFLADAYGSKVYRFSSMSLLEESSWSCLTSAAKFISTEKDKVLLVVEGIFVEHILFSLYPLHNSKYILMHRDVRAFEGKTLKIIYETNSLGLLSPTISSMAFIHHFEQMNLPWISIFKKRIFDETGVKDVQKYNHIISYFTKYLEIRRNLGRDIKNSYELYNMINLIVLLLKSFNSINNCRDLSAYICITGMFQDLSPDETNRCDILIRKATNIKIPNDLPVFDYFFDINTRSWKVLPAYDENVYNRFTFFALSLIRRNINLEIIGQGGSGKSSFLNSLSNELTKYKESSPEVVKLKGYGGGSILKKLVYFCSQKVSSSGILSFIDDVNFSPELEYGVKYISEHGRWWSESKEVDLKNISFVTTKLSRNNVLSYKSARIFLKPVDLQAVVSIYDTILKEHFSTFEIDIKFLKDKLLLSTYKIFHNIQEVEVTSFLRVEDFSRVMEGLQLSHEDCHDTCMETFDLWLNELKEIILLKLPLEKRLTYHERLKELVNHDFTDLNFEKDLYFGTFTNKESFYVDIEEDALDEYIRDLHSDKNFMVTRILRLQLCSIMKIFHLERRYLLMVNHDLESLTTVIEMCCIQKKIKLITIQDQDSEWEEKIRRVFVEAALNDTKVFLHVIFKEEENVNPKFVNSLNNLMSYGYDISSMKKNEFLRLFKDPSDINVISANFLSNIYCVVNAKKRLSDASDFVTKFQTLYYDDLDQYKEECLCSYEMSFGDTFSIETEKILTVLRKIPTNFESFDTSFERYKLFLKIFFNYMDFHIREDAERTNKIDKLQDQIEQNKNSVSLSLQKINELTQGINVLRVDFEKTSHELQKIKKEQSEQLRQKSAEFEHLCKESLVYFQLQLSNEEDRLYQNLHFDTLISNLGRIFRVNNFLYKEELYETLQSDVILQQFFNYLILWMYPEENFRNILDESEFARFMDKLNCINESSVSDLYKKQKASKAFDAKRLHKTPKNKSFLVLLLRKLDNLARSERILSKSYETKLDAQHKKICDHKSSFLEAKLRLYSLKKVLSEMENKKCLLNSQIDASGAEMEILTKKTKDSRGNEDLYEEFLNILTDLRNKNMILNRKLLGTTLLGSAFLGYAASTKCSHRLQMKRAFTNHLDENDVEYFENFLPFVCQKSKYDILKKEPLESVVENMLLINVADMPLTIIDEFDTSFFYLRKYMHLGDVRMVQAGDPNTPTQKAILSSIDPRSIKQKKGYFIYLTNESSSSLLKSKSTVVFDFYEKDLLENALEKLWRLGISCTIPYKGYLELNDKLLREFDALESVSKAVNSSQAIEGFVPVDENGGGNSFQIPPQDMSRIFGIRLCSFHLMLLTNAYRRVFSKSICSCYASFLETALHVSKERPDFNVKYFLKTFTLSVYRKLNQFQRDGQSLCLAFLSVIYFSKAFSKGKKMKAMFSLLSKVNMAPTILTLIRVITRNPHISSSKRTLLSFLWALKKLLDNKELRDRRMEKEKIPEIGQVLAKLQQSIILLVGDRSAISQILFDNAQNWTNGNVNVINPRGELEDVHGLIEECMLMGRWFLVEITDKCTFQYFELVYHLIVKVHLTQSKHASFQMWLHTTDIEVVPRKILENCRIITVD